MKYPGNATNSAPIPPALYRRDIGGGSRVVAGSVGMRNDVELEGDMGIMVVLSPGWLGG
jgi:hypothetical protein